MLDKNHTHKKCIQNLIDTGHWMSQQGWCPASSGNLSARLSPHQVMITVSGCSIGQLSHADLLQVDLDGVPCHTALKPSAETLLHTALYTLESNIAVILHTHSIASTVLSRITTANQIAFSGYEIQKALTNQHDHHARISLPVFDNAQDMLFLADQISQKYREIPFQWGFLLRGHGLYVFGKDINEARKHLECLEFLLACELQCLTCSTTST